jgi:hypothetical protein
MMGLMTNNTTLTAYSINVADSDTAPAWLALCATVAMGAQDSGRQRMTVTTAQPAALEAALAADDTVIEYAADSAAAETITAAQIRALRNEAQAAGDYAQVDICNRALTREIDGTQDQDGNEVARADLSVADARALCADAINAGQG